MYFEPGFIPYHSSEYTDDAMKPDLFFAPDPQIAYAPSPDSFDREVDNDKEFEELDLELSFKEFDDIFASFGITTPLAPSLVTDSTESVYSSQYSSALTPSDYSLLSREFESRGSAYDGHYGSHAPSYPAAFSNSLPFIPPPSPAKAAAVQESATFPPFAPAYVVPDEAHEADARDRPFKCHQCSFAFARKHNLKVHIKTHNNEKPYKCPTCKKRFTRKHDLQRHRESIHKEQVSSSSSVYSISKRTFDPMPDWPDLYHHSTNVNGTPAPMSSAYPGFNATIDVHPAEIAWLMGAQGVTM